VKGGEERIDTIRMGKGRRTKKNNNRFNFQLEKVENLNTFFLLLLLAFFSPL
jgi:hypothetical protein